MKKKILLVMSLCMVLMGLNVKAATITSGDTAMSVGVDDIGQLHSPDSDTKNIDGTGNTYTGDNDASTYVANDRTTQGQTFVTGADPDGYTLNGVYVKHVLYEDGMNNGTWSGLNDGTSVTVRVCSVSGIALTVLSSETATVATGSGIPGGGSNWGGTGKWLYIDLDTPVTLVAETEYAFDLTSYGPWFELAGLEAGPYTGGVAYSTAGKEDLDMGTVHADGDRTFVLDMTPQNKLVYDAPADDPEGDNLVLLSQVLSWTVNDAALTHIDLYVGPESEPNLILNHQKLSMEPISTVSYAPTLANETTYYWRIDAYEPNTLPGGSGYFKYTGPVWSFKTIPADAVISAVEPAYQVVPAGEPNVVLTVTGLSIDSYQWWKIGDPDVQLYDTDPNYSGVTTNTLTIWDVQEGNEGYYYCIGSNSQPSSDSNRDTGPGRVLTERMMSYYPFEEINTVDSNSITPDIIGGFDAMLKYDDPNIASLPILEPNVADASLGTYSLLFDNLDHATDPNGQFAQIDAGVVDYEDITISLWAYWNGGNEWQRIFDFGNNTTEYMFLTPDAGGTAGLRFAITTGGYSSEQTINAPALTVGEWTHIAVTIAPDDNGRLYVNGELIDTNPNLTLNPIDLQTTLNYIGKSNFVDPEFNGMVDEMKVYNKALTAQEIGQEYVDLMGGTVCNYELYDMEDVDLDGNCQVGLGDFAMIAQRWLDDYIITAQ